MSGAWSHSAEQLVTEILTRRNVKESYCFFSGLIRGMRKVENFRILREYLLWEQKQVTLAESAETEWSENGG